MLVRLQCVATQRKTQKMSGNFVTEAVIRAEEPALANWNSLLAGCSRDKLHRLVDLLQNLQHRVALVCEGMHLFPFWLYLILRAAAGCGLLFHGALASCMADSFLSD